MLKKLEGLKLPELERKILEFWRTDDTFQKSLKQTREGKPFVFFEGPPTANGRPGIHHVLSRAFKDIILRYKTMRGFHVPRRAGWDTHGLPVEIEVEKALGIKHKAEIEKFGIAEFNEQAKQSVWKYKGEWENLTHRMGFWLDVEHPYVTYENGYIESLWNVFQKIHKRGLLKKFYKVVPYCPRCQTPLSSHELAQPGAYKKTKDPSLYVKFELIEPRVKGQLSNVKSYLLVWTTTPWTLPANVAVAVNPKLTYTKFKVGDDYLWSHNPPPSPGGREGGQEIEVVEKISGKKLVGLRYRPLYEGVNAFIQKSLYKVLAADFVTVEDGTGLVHIAPAFGEDDLGLVKKELPEITAKDIPLTIDEQGKMAHGFPGAGEFIKKADEKIASDLTRRGLLYHLGTAEHEYPFCWRCSAPLIYFARDSWFVEMSRLRDELVRTNKKVNWIPEHIKEGRFGEWLKDIKDWAISRERYWGTPLPIWECEKCDAMTVAGSLADLEKHDYRKNTFMLLRHTEATHNLSGDIASGLERGKHVSKLTEKGARDAERIAKRLKSASRRMKIDLIFASPYKRTREMGEIIGKALKVPVVYDERLAEINTGTFNWRPVAEYHRFFKMPIEKFTQTPPGGESLTDVRRRMLEFAGGVNRLHRGKNVLVISHGYPLWMLEAGLKNLTNEEALEIGDPAMGELRKAPYRNIPRDKNGVLDLHRPYVDDIELICSFCKKGKMTRIKEVADVWFDSGAMPFAQWHYPFENEKLVDKGLQFPANYIAEGIDQTRGWFYTLLAVSLLMRRGAPYRNVIALGLVLDKNGQKMSKSKGNVVEPGAMFDQYGADVLRWYFYTVNAPGDPKRFDETELKKISNKVFSILYNSFVFFDTYADKSAKLDIPPQALGNVLDRWAMARLHETILDVTQKLEQYEIGEAARSLEQFIDDLSRWYIRRSRRRFQKQPRRSDSEPEVGAPTPGGVGGGLKDYEEASATLSVVLRELSILLAPFAPFFADALFQSLAHKASVHLADWPKGEKKFADKNLIAAMQEVRSIASEALALRATHGIKVRQPLAKLKIKNKISKINSELIEILKDEVNIKEVVFDPHLQEELELDLHITPELHAEGVLRDVIRSIQEARQDGKLRPKEEVFRSIETSDELLMKIIIANDAAISHMTGTVSVPVIKPENVLVQVPAKIDNKETIIRLQRKP